MDSTSFDRLARLLGAGATRRQSLAALLGAAFGSVAAADARGSRGKPSNRGADAQGPCGNGSRKDNRCSSDKQCCTGICDVELGKKNRDKVGRCRCLKNGRPCKADRNCCKSSVCFQGSCARCRKPDQSCEESSDCCGGNICLNGICAPCVASGAACSASGDCCSGLACYNGACAPCVADGKRCAAASDCCDGSICLDGVCASCTPEGGACVEPESEPAGAGAEGRRPRATLPCCSGLACADGVCHKPAVVKTGAPCVEELDTCEDPEASCTVYEFGEPEGTYCLLPRKAACAGDMECISRDCENRVCISCGFEACITPCTPVVCKSGCAHSTVQAAIDAADSYAIIDIGPGTYTEDLIVPVSLTLRACKGQEVILRNKTFGSRTIAVNGLAELALIDIIVDARNDPENQLWGGGISTFGPIGLFRNTVVRNAAWDNGGGIMVGTDQPPGFAPKGKVAARSLGRNLIDRVASRLPAELRLPADRINSANYSPYPIAVLISDQTVIQNNSATYFGGGVFASFEGLPVTSTPTSPLVPFILMSDTAAIRDNQVTSTTAPRGIQTQDATLTIYGGGGLFVVNGIVIVAEDSQIDRNIADWHGGGIMMLAMAFVVGWGFPFSVGIVGNARVSRNKSWLGGGVSILEGAHVAWGGLLLTGEAGISDNHADADGGGLYLDGVPLWTGEEAVISGNSAGGDGGGAIIVGPFAPGQDSYGASIEQSTSITGNSASRGAGLFVIGATVGMEGDTTIKDNVSEMDGGGAYLSYLAGAPGTPAGMVLIERAGITGNVAGDGPGGAGGGVFSDNVNNVVVGGAAITGNNPDNCVGSGSATCEA